MSSPNDPVHPGDGPGDGNGVSGNGGPPDHGDVPPWERGSSRARPTQRMTEHPPRTDGGRGGTTNGPSPVDARINRFMSGGSVSPARDSVPPRETASPLPPRETASPLPPRDSAAPPRDVPPRESTPPLRDSESVRPEVYASEIPDLSGPAPRPVRRNAVEPVAAESARAPRAGARTQVTNKAQGPVRASMQIRRLDPWSVLKVSLVLSVALFFVWMIAVAFLYLVLGGMGVWSKLNSNVGDLLTSSGGGGGELVSSGMIFGGALLIGLVNIVLLTAMATCGAFIYNLSTDIVGGIEVTLADRD